jgi:hypothetical protein
MCPPEANGCSADNADAKRDEPVRSFECRHSTQPNRPLDPTTFDRNPCALVSTAALRLRSLHGLRPTPLALVRLPITCLLKHMPVQPAPVRAARGSGMPLVARGKRGAPIYTVVDFEKERRLVSEEAVKAIQTALQRAGTRIKMEPGKVFCFESGKRAVLCHKHL